MSEFRRVHLTANCKLAAFSRTNHTAPGTPLMLTATVFQPRPVTRCATKARDSRFPS